MFKSILKSINDKKIIIIVSLIVIFVAIAVLIIFKSFTTNNFYSGESKVADDSKESMNILYQKHEKSKAKFYVYGEVLGDYKITMATNCDGKKNSVILSEKKVSVDNHCILSFTPKTYSEKRLTAYIITPDSSLIAIRPINNSVLQLNAYKNETRVVLEKGIIFNRIAEQKNNNKFTIQIANTIFESLGNQEMSAYSHIIDSKTAFDLLYRGYTVKGGPTYEQIITENIVGVASFQVVSGNSKIKRRGSSTVLNADNFAYYKNGDYNDILFTDNGYSEFNKDYEVYKDDNKDFLDDQKTLDNNKKIDFIGIAKHETEIDVDKLNEIMKKYYDYYSNKSNNNDNTDTDNNDDNDTDNRNACEIFKSLSGFTPTDICWCRNDIHISDSGLEEINSKGYNYSKSDLIYCNTYTLEDTGGGMGRSLEGMMLKDCARELGWNGTYSNEGGYDCGSMSND